MGIPCLALSEPPRILIHQYFILKLSQSKILNTDLTKNNDFCRDHTIRVITILEYSKLQ